MIMRAGLLAAAVLLAGVGSAAAQAAAPAAAPDTAGAEAFIRELFAPYAATTPSVADTTPRTAAEQTAHIAAGEARTYAPELADLMRRDRASTPEGELGTLDYDPICGCQDNGRITVDRVALTPAPEGRVWAAATFTDHEVGNPETGQPSVTSTRRFLLERTPAGWRVADVRSDDESDAGLLAMMREGVAGQEAAGRGDVRPAR